jgi:PAS domain S-box-containing protein
LLGFYYSVTAFQSGPGQCAVTFVDITERKRVEQALAESEERFRKIFEDGPLGMAMASLTTGKLFRANKAFCDMLGFTEEELIQTTFVGITHAEDQDADIAAVNDLLEGRIHKYAREKRYLKKNGDALWGALALAKIYSEREQSYYALAMIEDITTKKLAEEENKKLNAELEIKVEQRTAELKEVNKELETFTYSVSHDLKAPLRGIDGYSKLLLELYKPDLNEEAQRFLETIRSSTLHMSRLIDDLLNYSRLERSQLSLDSIRINDLITSAVSDFRADLEDGKFNVQIISPEIDIIVDLKGLTIALRNLLENAIKFTRGRPEPLIQIEVSEKYLSWIICIRDNGIGFDMKYHSKIFEIFQRLHRMEDFPGTGIGLAMVSKAMHRMHGKAWADSTPGLGSAFYLEIPKKQSNE